MKNEKWNKDSHFLQIVLLQLDLEDHEHMFSQV